MLCFHVQRDSIDRLQEPNEEIRDLVVCKLDSLSAHRKKSPAIIVYLLTNADARTGVEWQEDEGIWRQVLV